ncbi:hypothetical protein IWQ62_000704 [Dispira parvispora]|uniref:Cation-transporting P-type ATPase N-terminal domain-containing protein n=1 Tax=Dispira parvispora TaxID=1520584 RepID=A0A9W8AU85_9FUNG|nr:hypothetical protein IWQ62_000704 [Dispira parvispora]
MPSTDAENDAPADPDDLNRTQTPGPVTLPDPSAPAGVTFRLNEDGAPGADECTERTPACPAVTFSDNKSVESSEERLTLLTETDNDKLEKEYFCDAEKGVTVATTTSPSKKTRKEIHITEHLLTLEQLCDQLGTAANPQQPGQSNGLKSDLASIRLQEHGPNILTPPKQRHPFFHYLDHLRSMFNLLLIIAGILDFILLSIDPEGNRSNIYLGAILIVVAFLNAFIEFYQMHKSKKILESFSKMVPQKCHVVREQTLVQLPAADLVVGDVVYVNQGDKVPADIFVFASTELKVDNSSLTGESDPQPRGSYNSLSNPLEATNLLFSGTLVVSGEGYGIVIKTGDSTVLGQIAGLTAGEEKNPSPLSQEIDRFVKIIATIAIVTAIIFFVVSVLIYHNAPFAINFAIGVFVAWVPQGLMATVTLLLTIAAKRLTKHNVLVKDLQGVETLGAITLLATDKTGTLTRNQMTVTNLWTGLQLYTTSKNSQNQGLPFNVEAPGIQEMLAISSLCSRVKFDRTDIPMEERQILGDATETGLIRFAARHIEDLDQRSTTYPKVFEIPFNSERKWHMTIHRRAHRDGPLTLYLKGAPERVLRICSTVFTAENPVPLTDQHRQEFQSTYEYMASLGHRVLAFAQLQLPGDIYPEDYNFDRDAGNYPSGDLCFVGLVSLEDPPKHGVREAIGRCREAGIQVVMVTGDHPLTAEAIGRKINLVVSETRDQVAKRTRRPIEDVADHEYSAIVIHGESIDGLTEHDWDHIFSKNEIIFARTSPKHKLQIVKHAQSMGHIVGVTGDGVNDSPALKKADLGIAMHHTGSDVSKEAAAMILLDDNFSSIVHGIEQGRLIFTNLKKSIQYTVTHSTPEVIPNLLYIVVPLPLPLSAILILAIDLGFELIISLSYAWEPPETKTGLMKLPPRRPITEESIRQYRERMARLPAPMIDPETGEEIQPSRLRRVLRVLGTPLTRLFWLDLLEKKNGEVLVDGGLLSWAYLEFGTLEALSCLTTYFLVLYRWGITPAIAREMAKTGNYFKETSPLYENNTAGLRLTGEQQYQALCEAQSAFYLAIMISQIFNAFACKTKLRLPLGKHMFRNRTTFYCIAGGVALAMLVVYVPPLNYVFLSEYHLSPIYWLVPIAFGVVIIAYACLRIVVLRFIRPVQWSPDISGLQMYPTVWSQQSAGKVA